MKKFKFAGFTLVELLVVVSIISVLAGLVLFGSGYAQKKGMMSRARAEITAMSAACENYKADNGNYPMATGTTDKVFATGASPSYDPTQNAYQYSSFYLYTQLSGDPTGSGTITSGTTVYLPFKPNQLYVPNSSAPIGSGNKVQYIVDPFGYSYGYSTIVLSNFLSGTTSSQGYNSTFDLWSTSGKTTSSGTAAWIANWNNN